jgi:hypothetical protein
LRYLSLNIDIGDLVSGLSDEDLISLLAGGDADLIPGMMGGERGLTPALADGDGPLLWDLQLLGVEALLLPDKLDISSEVSEENLHKNTK